MSSTNKEVTLERVPGCSQVRRQTIVIIICEFIMRDYSDRINTDYLFEARQC